MLCITQQQSSVLLSSANFFDFYHKSKFIIIICIILITGHAAIVTSILRPAHYAGLTALLCMHVMLYRNFHGGAACHNVMQKEFFTGLTYLREPRARAYAHVRSSC